MEKVKFQPIIGLEIHIELKTKSKMFCSCSADYFGKPPNTLTCPVCLGLPGALPVPNKKAIEQTTILGLALNCKISSVSKFDRKNYFYPDLPKGYQISQYDLPFATNGKLKFQIPKSKFQIRIRRVHLEEDTAKMIHFGNFTLIDFNRSGVPLVEIVTEPDFESSSQVEEFLKYLQRLVRWLGISQADMEKGQMRCEPTVNLKVVKEGKTYYTPLVELKNINSFRFVRKAIDWEIQRQLEEFEKTGKVKERGNKTTRGWDEKTGTTVLQREKEEASDYRYFPEPDIPPIKITKSQILNLKSQIGELPQERLARFMKEYGISEYNAKILTEEKDVSDYFEKAVKTAKGTFKPVFIANIIINKKVDIGKVSPENLVKTLLKQQKSTKISGIDLEKIILEVLNENQKAVEDYKKGKTNALQFLIGQVMAKTKGQANIGELKEGLIKLIS
jgi:aspartyl-tRNA(Asn)/glutamyl-tRNA(Gln) amidotransferase subunit B